MVFVLVLVALVFLAKGNNAAGEIPFPDANVPILPATPEQIDTLNDQLSDQIAFDIATGSTRVLKVGETIIGASFAGVSALAGAGTTATTTGTLLFTATSWTIIGGIVAAGFAIIMALRSNVHLYANELVDKYENPFGQFLTQSRQRVDANVSVLQSLEVKQIYNGVFVGWGNYRAAMLDLIGRGGSWEIVAKQSLNNLNNEFFGERLSNGNVLGLGMGGAFPDGFINAYFRSFDATVADLESQGR